MGYIAKTVDRMGASEKVALREDLKQEQEPWHAVPRGRAFIPGKRTADKSSVVLGVF